MSTTQRIGMIMVSLLFTGLWACDEAGLVGEKSTADPSAIAQGSASTSAKGQASSASALDVQNFKQSSRTRRAAGAAYGDEFSLASLAEETPSLKAAPDVDGGVGEGLQAQIEIESLAVEDYVAIGESPFRTGTERLIVDGQDSPLVIGALGIDALITGKEGRIQLLGEMDDGGNYGASIVLSNHIADYMEGPSNWDRTEQDSWTIAHKKNGILSFNFVSHTWDEETPGSDTFDALISNPSMVLNSDGHLQVKKLIVTANIADYVFDENYKLLPLAEVKRFIDKNKHLPGIASEKEIQNAGGTVSLGDAYTQMMQKIEELTLYTIEQQERIDAQQKQMTAMQRELLALRNRSASTR